MMVWELIDKLKSFPGNSLEAEILINGDIFFEITYNHGKLNIEAEPGEENERLQRELDMYDEITHELREEISDLKAKLERKTEK